MAGVENALYESVIALIGAICALVAFWGFFRGGRLVVLLAVGALALAASGGRAEAGLAGLDPTPWLIVTQINSDGSTYNYYQGSPGSCSSTTWPEHIVGGDGTDHGTACLTPSAPGAGEGGTEQGIYDSVVAAAAAHAPGGVVGFSPATFMCPEGYNETNYMCLNLCGNGQVAQNGQCVDPCALMKGYSATVLSLDGNWLDYFSPVKAPSNPWTYPVKGDGSVGGNGTVSCWVNLDVTFRPQSGVSTPQKGTTSVSATFRGTGDAFNIGISLLTLYGTTVGAIAGTTTSADEQPQSVECTNCDLPPGSVIGLPPWPTTVAGLYTPQYASFSAALTDAANAVGSTGALNWLSALGSVSVGPSANYNGGDPLMTFGPLPARWGGGTYSVHFGALFWSVANTILSIAMVIGLATLILRR